MPKKSVDKYVGLKYNRLTILKIIEGDSQRRKVLVQCECGRTKECFLGHILRGNTSSCGCLAKERTSAARRTHGLTSHKLYSVWTDMKTRCYNKNRPSYKNYGAIGVRVCDEWKNNFKIFFDWAIKNGWDDSLELDKDILGNGLLYCPKYCCFVPAITNLLAKKNIRRFDFNGRRLTLSEISEITGENRKSLATRVYRHKTIYKT